MLYICIIVVLSNCIVLLYINCVKSTLSFSLPLCILCMWFVYMVMSFTDATREWLKKWTLGEWLTVYTGPSIPSGQCETVETGQYNFVVGISLLGISLGPVGIVLAVYILAGILSLVLTSFSSIRYSLISARRGSEFQQEVEVSEHFDNSLYLARYDPNIYDDSNAPKFAPIEIRDLAFV